MKKAIFATPNRMKFESLHKTFNKQIDCISTGNVIGDVQYSSYIRAYNNDTINWNDGDVYKTVPKGQLQDFDLKGFVDKGIPSYILSFIREELKDKSGILYLFRHWNNGQMFKHGYVLTDTENNLIKVWYMNNNYKSISVVDEAIKYITN